MKRSFTAKAIPSNRVPSGFIFKVVRDDMLQMCNLSNMESAEAYAQKLNSQAQMGIGNAHRLRNDGSIPSKIEMVIVRAWVRSEKPEGDTYKQVRTKEYGREWADFRRTVLIKNFAKDFHPQQRHLIVFTIEYIRCAQELAANNKSVSYISDRIFFPGTGKVSAHAQV